MFRLHHALHEYFNYFENILQNYFVKKSSRKFSLSAYSLRTTRGHQQLNSFYQNDRTSWDSTSYDTVPLKVAAKLFKLALLIKISDNF